MYILRYLTKHIRRTFLKSIMTILLSLILIILINMFGNSKTRQLAELEQIYDEFEIQVVVSNVSGSNTENLKLSYKYINSFTSEYSGLSKYLKDVNLKRSIGYASVDGITLSSNSEPGALIGITRIEAAFLLSFENGASIRFLQGYDKSAFLLREPICLISAELLDMLNKSPGDVITIMLPDANKEAAPKEITAEMKIVGTISGSSVYNIYCPWNIINSLASEFGNFEYYSESMSATITENQKIDEFIEKSKELYTKTSVVDMDKKYDFALTINDEVFNGTVKELKQNAKLNNTMMIIISFLSAMLGFVVCYLSVRNRKWEFAVMRSIGISRNKVFLTIFLEQLVLCLSGAVIGMVCSLIIWRSVTLIGNGAIFACFALGTVLSTLSQTNINIMDTMKIKE